MQSLELTIKTKEALVIRFFVVVSLVFLLGGCSFKNPYMSSKSYHVVIKNKQIALSDTGFIKKDSKRFNLQLFSAGTPVLDLLIKDDVCLDYVCVSKEKFNSDFFGYSHYKTFVDDLFNFKPIYNGKSLKKLKNGFNQSLKTKHYDVFYEIKEDSLYFKDKQNRVLIKLKEIR